MNDAPSHQADTYEATLRKLTRAKLQKLAKKNKIKANMKSETIIQELLKLYRAVQLHQDEGNEEHLRKTGRTSMQDQRASDPTRRTSGEIPLVAGPSTQIIDTVVDTNLDHQSTQEGSQESALETPPPERPQMFNRVVDTMNKITSDDQRILAHISVLHDRAKMLREQAKDVRDVMRAEQGQRMRLEAYFAHRLLQGDFA